MLLIAIIISLIAAYYSFDSYWEDDRVRVITEFQGVKLGWAKDEVLFRKGEPTFVDEGNKNQELIYGAMTVLLDKNKVIAIQYDCKLEEYSHEKVGGISCNDDVDRIVNQYGEAKNKVVSDDKLRRLYNYPEYNLAFALSRSKADLLTVIDSKNSPEGYKFKTFTWEKDSLIERNNKPTFTEEENAEFQAMYDAEKKLVKPKAVGNFDPDAYLAEKRQAKPNNKNIDTSDVIWDEPNKTTKADGEYVTDEKLLAELNSDKSLSGQKVQEDGDLEALWAQAKPDNATQLDHCAPDLTKTERLQRLALKGTVRETGYQTYSTGNYEIVFSANSLYRCR